MDEPITDTAVHDELGALRRIVRELDRLDLATRDRAMRWLADRYITSRRPES